MFCGALASLQRLVVVVTGCKQYIVLFVRLRHTTRKTAHWYVLLMVVFSQLSQAMRKDIRALQKKAQRDSEQVLVLEGEKLVDEALACGADLQLLVVHSSSPHNALVLAERSADMGIPVYTTSPQHFALLCDTKTPQGILAIVDYPQNKPDFSGGVLVLDSIADPGNVGTIIRTADWFGYNTIVLGPGCADRFHPKTLRSTMGSIFRVAVHTSGALASDIREHLGNHALYGATLEATQPLASISPIQRHALVLGSESHGISHEVRALLTQEFRIPGCGGAESLNVAVAAGITLYHCAQAGL